MQSYIVTAHHSSNENRVFHISYKAHSINHAGALFLSDMEQRGYSVVVERLVGGPIVLSKSALPGTVILDRIRSVH